MSNSRREQRAESLLVAAGERRDRSVKASTQFARLAPEARSSARSTLDVWYGGSARGVEFTAGKTRRRRLEHHRRGVLAATGTPLDQQPVSSAGVAKAYQGLDLETRQRAEDAVAGLGPAADLADVPRVEAPEPVEAEPVATTEPGAAGVDVDEDLDEFFDDLDADELGRADELDLGADVDVEGLPGRASDAEMDEFWADDGVAPTGPISGDDVRVPTVIEGREVWPYGPERPGHWHGPMFDDPWSAAGWANREGLDPVAVVCWAGDTDWGIYFPDSP